MDPNKIKEVKQVMKKQSKLANLKRIKELTFKYPQKLVICSWDNIYNTNNQLRNISKEVTDEIENLIQDWLEKTEEEINKEIENI